MDSGVYDGGQCGVLGAVDGRVIQARVRDGEAGAGCDCLRMRSHCHRHYNSIVACFSSAKCPEEVGVLGRSAISCNELPVSGRR
jgi:hypothetical protein